MECTAGPAADFPFGSRQGFVAIHLLADLLALTRESVNGRYDPVLFDHDFEVAGSGLPDSRRKGSHFPETAKTFCDFFAPMGDIY